MWRLCSAQPPEIAGSSEVIEYPNHVELEPSLDEADVCENFAPVFMQGTNSGHIVPAVRIGTTLDSNTAEAADEDSQPPPVRLVAPAMRHSLDAELTVEEATRLGANCTEMQLKDAVSRLPRGKAGKWIRSTILRHLNAKLLPTPSAEERVAFDESLAIAVPRTVRSACLTRERG